MDFLATNYLFLDSTTLVRLDSKYHIQNYEKRECCSRLQQHYNKSHLKKLSVTVLLAVRLRRESSKTSFIFFHINLQDFYKSTTRELIEKTCAGGAVEISKLLAPKYQMIDAD